MEEIMVKLYSIGGSGENGRNCYAVEWTDGAILLDCGVTDSLLWKIA